MLPFANLSPIRRRYFADGMTDELINALAKVPGLRRLAHLGIRVQGPAAGHSQIGGQLSVESCWRGACAARARRLRAVQLINVADGYQLWSETFDREMEDVFAIQDEISRGS